jgi:hypothetical protein
MLSVLLVSNPGEISAREDTAWIGLADHGRLDVTDDALARIKAVLPADEEQFTSNRTKREVVVLDFGRLRAVEAILKREGVQCDSGHLVGENAPEMIAGAPCELGREVDRVDRPQSSVPVVSEQLLAAQCSVRSVSPGLRGECHEARTSVPSNQADAMGA